MITEDDDDTHICLKCHTTITGLDNYVSHRKAGCGTQAPVHAKPRALSPLMPPDEPDFALKADDFFSLLELQSSSKKSSLQVPTSGKSSSGVLTRSKATAVIQASNINKASVWIGGHELRELGNEDNQTKLINAVDNISGNQIKKVELTRLSYDVMIEDDSNDDSDDDEEEFEDVECHNAPPRSHTGGKWKPSASPIQWLRPSSSHSHEDRTDWDDPPPSHTGGKWKPTPPSHTRRLSEGDDDEDKNAPPPDHTKGKWIPGRTSTDTPNQDEIPPLRKSSGTVQYWCGPCNRRLASKVVYERHLRSELHYKRTLHEREFENSSEYLNQKNLTRKRVQGKRKVKKPINFWLNTEATTNKDECDNKQGLKKCRLKKQIFVRCEVCRSKVLTHLMGKHLISHYHCRKRNILRPVAQQMVLDNILDIVLQSPFQCSACRFFCNKQSDFMRHWRSFEHNSVTERTDGFFLCSFCKFECQYNNTMEEHLLSDAHKEVVSVINRSVPIIIRRIFPVRCSSCDKQFRYNAELLKHCLKTNHTLNYTCTDEYQGRHNCSECKLILKSSKSLQKHLLRKHGKNYYFCSICSIEFETYMESKLHRKTQQHKYAVVSRNYENGNDIKDITRACQYCYLRFPNALHLKEHLRKEHPEHSFSCPQCGKKFTLSQEVTRHIKAKACSFESGPNVAFFNCEKCPYKVNSEGDFLFHVALHTEPQPVYETRGQDDGATSKKPPVNQYKCPVCDKLFRKSSLRCHIRLHTNEKPFKCEFCKAAYARKNNLVDHVKQNHEDEYKKKVISDDEFRQSSGVQKFACSICENSFDDRDQLQHHIQVKHNDVSEENKLKKKPKALLDSAREKRFLCSFCGKSFLKKFTLVQHAKLHTGKESVCPHAGCVYRARSAAELRPHLATHSDLRPFACPHCDYCTKTKPQLTRHVKRHEEGEGRRFSCPFCSFSARVRSHLRRHMRLHSGAKPYCCPHCTYTCNNLENLRKHVLLTNKHPGKCIYECKFCEAPNEYATNFAKDFRMHLISSHSDMFGTIKEATTFVAGIYSAEEDTKLTQTRSSPIILSKSNKSHKSKSHSSPNTTPQMEIILKDDLPVISAATSSTSNSQARSTILLTSAAEHRDPVPRTTVDSELLPMVVVEEENVVYVETPSAGTDVWTMEGYYDVEESGTLVPFHSENEGLLVEHFEDDSN